jgi:hypothetical protein
MNPRKNKHPKTIWFRSETEYHKLLDLCQGNFQGEAGRIITEILNREENK